DGSAPLPPLDPRARRRIWWVAFWAFWTTFGILLAAPRVLFYRESAGPSTWGEALPIAILDMYSWSLVAVNLVDQDLVNGPLHVEDIPHLLLHQPLDARDIDSDHSTGDHTA